MLSTREMLTRLVAIPSPSSVSPGFDRPNRPVIDLLATWLADLGCEVQVQPLPDQPAKANLTATLGQGPGGLVLAGHTDTVPCDPDRWRTDPLALTESDGHYIGLGAADMKGFLAAAVSAVARARVQRLREPLIVMATADEESTMDGARALQAAGAPGARHVVIGEPTRLRPVRAHKGILMEAVRLVGRSGHSSDPSLGNSALEGMYTAIGALLAWRTELQQAHRDSAFAVPVPTLNLGRIEGGDNPNRICGACELHLDLRVMPGMDLGDLRVELRRRLETALAGSGLGLELRPLDPGTPPLATPANAPIVRAAERLCGHPAEAVAFCTEGPYFQALGMDVVILGPGDIAQAHQPNESISVASLDAVAGILDGLIAEFCGA